MSRPKAIVPTPDYVKPEDIAKRKLQGPHEAKHANGHAKSAPTEPTDEMQYWPI